MRRFSAARFPVQGPPGSGKTHTGSRMICTLAESGKRIGVTANSHKVIRNLLDEVIKAADELGVAVECIQKVPENQQAVPHLRFTKDNAKLLDAIGSGCQVGGGTAWLWAHPNASQSLDVLFIDEAAQMSLASVLAASQSAQTLVLLGDPRQLEQPLQGTHPEGTDVSALDHMLGGHATVPPDRGLFLEETWRLHPDICAYTSELFYEGRLRSRPGLERQRMDSAGSLDGSGLRYLPVVHEGNQSSSPEEADRIRELVEGLLNSGASFTDKDGNREPVGARRHPDHRSVQRPGLRAPGPHSRRQDRDRRQVPGPAGPHRHLFDDDIHLCRRAARDGVSLQPEPAQRGDIAREGRLRPGRLPAALRGGMPDAQTDAVGERILPLPRTGDGHLNEGPRFRQRCVGGEDGGRRHSNRGSLRILRSAGEHVPGNCRNALDDRPVLPGPLTSQQRFRGEFGELADPDVLDERGDIIRDQ